MLGTYDADLFSEWNYPTYQFILFIFFICIQILGNYLFLAVLPFNMIGAQWKLYHKMGTP